MTAIGYLLPTRELVMSGDAPDFTQILHLAERAEGLGLDSVWVGDSILARPRFEPLTTLAAVAARTTRVKLGTAVFLPALRQPIVLANEIANVDIISGGRLILGLGIAGANASIAREFAACGVPFEHRVGVFEEVVTLLRRLWTEEEVTFEGRYVQAHEVRLGLRPVQPGGPPLWLAGGVENALRRALRLGDGWFPISASPEIFAANRLRLRTLGEELGRDADELHRAYYTTLTIDEDQARADQTMRAFIENYYGVPYETIKAGTGLHAGGAESCIAWLNAFIAAGIQTLVIRFASPDQAGQLERLARDVLPHVQR